MFHRTLTGCSVSLTLALATPALATEPAEPVTPPPAVITPDTVFPGITNGWLDFVNTQLLRPYLNIERDPVAARPPTNWWWSEVRSGVVPHYRYAAIDPVSPTPTRRDEFEGGSTYFVNGNGQRVPYPLTPPASPPAPPPPPLPAVERYPAAPDWAVDRITATYDASTGELWMTIHEPVALFGVMSESRALRHGDFGPLDNFGGRAVVNSPHAGELAWVTPANILGGPGSAPVGGAIVTPGTPLSDLTLLYQLVGNPLWRGTITPVGDAGTALTAVPEPAAAALLALAAATLIRRRR